MADLLLDFRDIHLARAAHSPRDFPRDGRPQICFAGRSNVGKSSLLNTLVGRRSLARTSKTPGRTREIHFFAVADRFYLVDLPGYGYAHVSRQVRERWGHLIETYIVGNDLLRLLVVIFDIRHDPTPDDLDLIAWLESLSIPYVLALTKSDKVSNNAAANQHRRILGAVSRQGSIDPGRVIRFSARTGEGRLPLLHAIEIALGQSPTPPIPAKRHSS